MEKLSTKAVSLSFGITTASVYIACVIFVAVAPLETTIAIGNSLVHGIDISSIATKRISFITATIGLVVSFIGTVAIGYIFASLYNWIGEKLQ